MQPDQPIMPVVPAENPVVSGENTQDKSVEVAVTPEILVNSRPVDPVTAKANDPVAVPSILADDAADNLTPQETPTESLDDTAVLSGDAQYFSAVKQIIHDDADKPYEEEADSEVLQKGYLKERFGVNVEVDEEEK